MWTEQLYHKGKQSPQEYQRKKIQIVNLKVDVLQEHILKEEPITPIPEYIFLQNDTLKPYPQLQGQFKLLYKLPQSFLVS